jgi:hypothetical protein
MRTTVDPKARVRPRRLAPAAAIAASVPEWRAWLRDPWTWVVAAGCAMVLIMSVGGISQLLDRDEGAFLAIAYEIQHGRLPYRDVFDQKGPGIYYFLATVLTLTSPLSKIGQILVARSAVLLLNLATAAGLVAVGRRWWRLEVGVLAALLWLFALPIFGGDQFYTEPFATAFTVWAVVVAGRWPGLRGAFAAGVLVAVGSLFKQTAVLAGPGVAVVVLAADAVTPWWKPSRQRLLGLGALAAGTIAPWLVVCACFVVAGGFGQMVDQVLVSNLVRYPADSPEMIRIGIHNVFQAFRALWIVPLGVIAVGLWRWISAEQRAPSAGALAVVLLGVLNLAPFKSHAYWHYLIQVVPWAAVLAAIGFMAVLGAWRSQPGRPAREEGASPRALLAPVLVMLVIGLMSGRSFIGSEVRVVYPGLRGQAETGAWIAQYAPPGSRLLIAPAEPEYYYLANRLPTTSYVYMLPINLTPAFLTQVCNQIQSDQFDIVVWFQSGGGGGHEPYFAGLHQTLQQYYHIIAEHAAEQTYIFVPNGPAQQTNARGTVPRRT